MVKYKYHQTSHTRATEKIYGYAFMHVFLRPLILQEIPLSLILQEINEFQVVQWWCNQVTLQVITAVSG